MIDRFTLLFGLIGVAAAVAAKIRVTILYASWRRRKKNNIKCKDWCTVPGSEAHTTHTNVAINFLKRVIMMKIPWVHLWSNARAIIFKIAHTNASKFILNVRRREASNLLLQRANYSQIDSHCTTVMRRIGCVFLLRTIHMQHA